MSGLTAQFVVLLMFSCLVTLCEETLNVTVKTGEDVTLKCQKDTDESITVIKWSRPDLKSKLHVFFFRENRPYKHYHHRSFHGRVKLRDPEMKNGDASVILTNVNVNDTGTYECFVGTDRNTKFNQFINLKVTESGPTAGNPEERGDEERGDKEGGDEERGNLTAPLLTAAVVICVVGGLVGFVLWKSQRSQQQNSDPPAADELQPL